MIGNKAKVIFENQSHIIDLQNTFSLKELMNCISQRFLLVNDYFVLKQNQGKSTTVDNQTFQRLRYQNTPVTLYVLRQQSIQENKVQNKFCRLNLSQNNCSSQQVEIEFQESSYDSKHQFALNEREGQLNSHKMRSFMKEYEPQSNKNAKQVNQKLLQRAQSSQKISDLNVQCDICFTFPIKDQIFKCLVCKQFDLCVYCEQHYHHFHPLLQITKKQQYPRQISILFSQQQGKYMNEKLEQQKATIKEVKNVFYQKDEQHPKLKEIDPLTLKSKKIKGKNFAAYIFDPLHSF